MLTTVRETEFAKVYTLCDIPNSVYLKFILSCIHGVFNTCIWSITSKPVECVEGNNKISFDVLCLYIFRMMYQNANFENLNYHYAINIL
jgi:hypothetical protein